MSGCLLSAILIFGLNNNWYIAAFILQDSFYMIWSKVCHIIFYVCPVSLCRCLITYVKSIDNLWCYIL